jgi:hypothetical protein
MCEGKLFNGQVDENPFREADSLSPGPEMCLPCFMKTVNSLSLPQQFADGEFHLYACFYPCGASIKMSVRPSV